MREYITTGLLAVVWVTAGACAVQGDANGLTSMAALGALVAAFIGWRWTKAEKARSDWQSHCAELANRQLACGEIDQMSGISNFMRGADASR